MEERKRRRIPSWVKIVIAVVVTLFVSIGSFCLLIGRGGMTLLEGWLLARYAFVDTEADLDVAVDHALAGLVSGLGDRWSYYLDEENYQRVMTSRTNSYVGVGITISYEREEGLLVLEVTEESPAEQAGIVAGDMVIAVDGVSIAGALRQDGAARISGDAGTQVELTLLDEKGNERTVVCTRAALRTVAASGEMLADGIGYVKLNNFYSGSCDSFREEVEALRSQGTKNLIIDLRGNPGGYVSELKQILDYLLPEGPVFTEKPRWGRQSVYRSDAECVELPMVVLVNAESYSAAELLAAQLRESIGAPIVGEVTSGKGYSQITFPLPNGGGLGLSTATYCTGNGHSLIGEGILPDVELSLTEGEDNQLQAAIELLVKK